MGGASSFNPYNELPHLAGVWMGDPNATPLTEGASVPSWRTVGSLVAADIAQATGSAQPLYRSSVAGLNGLAALEFARASSQVLDNNIVDQVQPFHGLAVYLIRSTSANQALLGGFGSAAKFFLAKSSTQAQLNLGTALSWGVTPTTAVVARFTANGASSLITLNETTPVTGDAGTTMLSRFTLGAASTGVPAFSTFFDGFAHYAGYFDATKVASAEVANLARKFMLLAGIPG